MVVASSASRRITAWVALVALLAAALLPALTHAIGPARASVAWAGDVCTAMGPNAFVPSRPAGPSGSDPAAPASGGAHAEHCALCALSGIALAPAPDAAGWRPRVASSEGRVALVATMPSAPAAWPAARPRGPPASA